jgi:hypothetical protein
VRAKGASVHSWRDDDAPIPQLDAGEAATCARAALPWPNLHARRMTPPRWAADGGGRLFIAALEGSPDQPFRVLRFVNCI